MDSILVTGRVSARPYLIPISDIGLIEETSAGANIHLKQGSSFKYCMVECSETVQEIRKEIGSLN